MKPAKEEEFDNGGVTNVAVDRLSGLPDSLICHIMSFLPTKTSVATMSLVSHRYLHLWKDLQVFYFNFHRSIPFRKVASFVNSVLILRKYRDIQNFHLTFDCDRYEQLYHEAFQSQVNSVETWILASIGP
jgi:hypothetical protein